MLDEHRTLTLIHGTPLGPGIWNDVIEAAPRRNALAVDVTRAPPERPQEALARRIADELDGALDVVGHSFGGQVALDLALLIPERVRSLTLLCTRDSPYPAFAASAREILEGSVPSIKASMGRWFTPEELAEGGSAVIRARDSLQHAVPDDWAAALQGVASFDRRARVVELRMPTTVISAGSDQVSTPEVMTEMAHRIPNARLILRPQWAHMSPFAHTHDLVALLGLDNPAGTRATR